MPADRRPVLAPGAGLGSLAGFEAAMRRYDDDRLRVGPVKLYIDDVMEQHTAALLEPYADQPGTRGGTFYDPGEFAELVAALDARRLQVLVHALGDRGVQVALDAVACARQVNGPRDARHQLVHVELAAARDLARFAELGVVAGAQSIHSGGWSADFSLGRSPGRNRSLYAVFTS